MQSLPYDIWESSNDYNFEYPQYDILCIICGWSRLIPNVMTLITYSIRCCCGPQLSHYKGHPVRTQTCGDNSTNQDQPRYILSHTVTCCVMIEQGCIITTTFIEQLYRNFDNSCWDLWPLCIRVDDSKHD